MSEHHKESQPLPLSEQIARLEELIDIRQKYLEKLYTQLTQYQKPTVHFPGIAEQLWQLQDKLDDQEKELQAKGFENLSPVNTRERMDETIENIRVNIERVEAELQKKYQQLDELRKLAAAQNPDGADKLGSGLDKE